MPAKKENQKNLNQKENGGQSRLDEEGGFKQRNQVRDAPDFDYNSVVLNKLRDLRFRYKQPVSLEVLSKEFGQKLQRSELVDVLGHLQEAGEVRQVPGPELRYDVY